MTTKKKPLVIDERKITVDGKEYTLAELQALYDAIGAVPGIQQKVQTITVEKIVERDKTAPWPPTQPLRPYWQDPIILRPLTEQPYMPTINPALPTIVCDSTIPPNYVRIDPGLPPSVIEATLPSGRSVTVLRALDGKAS